MMDAKHHNALTLVEILIVVAIIAVLTMIVIGLTLRVENQSKAKALSNIFALLDSALQEYREYKGQFPVPVPVFTDAVDLDPDVVTERERQDRAADRLRFLYTALHSVPASREILKTIGPAWVEHDVSDPNAYVVRDPWGTVLDCRYAPGDQFPELISAGPDTKFLRPSDEDNVSSREQ